MSTTNDDDKPDTKFRPCRFACGETVWSERTVVCPQCKEALAMVARSNAVARRAAPTDERLGAAYLRGLGVRKYLVRGY